MRLTFLGATQTVTGSKTLLQAGGRNVLIDCGLFQGQKELKERNWAELPIAARTIDAVILTHAHLDHSGYLPVLVKKGFRGPVYCTPATRDLCEILLVDSGDLLERDAEFANRHGYSRHKPALPLYTAAEARAGLKHLRTVPFGVSFTPGDGLTAMFLPAGHILGAAMVRLSDGRASALFSGDLGRPHDPVMLEPARPPASDYIVVEATYGNRRHEATGAEERLADAITRTAAHGGAVIIPAFAVGRAQSLLYHLERLKAQSAIPRIPIYLDSPMAVDASDIFCRHVGEHRLRQAECRRMCHVAQYVRSAEESKAIDRQTMPRVIISASGMATGGRVLHHLKAMAADPRNTILLTGFQAAGTRGAQLLAGARELTIHGQSVPVRAAVESLHMLSAHADADEILGWLGNLPVAPEQAFVIHGEAQAAETLRDRISAELGWQASTPRYGQSFDLRPRNTDSGRMDVIHRGPTPLSRPDS